jgi:hypothetical protein
MASDERSCIRDAVAEFRGGAIGFGNRSTLAHNLGNSAGEAEQGN